MPSLTLVRDVPSLTLARDVSSLTLVRERCILAHITDVLLALGCVFSHLLLSHGFQAPKTICTFHFSHVLELCSEMEASWLRVTRAGRLVSGTKASLEGGASGWDPLVCWNRAMFLARKPAVRTPE